MAHYGRHVSALATPQREKARKDQRQNRAGGYAFALDLWARLDRWLVLGCEGGSYYASEKAMTRDNARTVEECLAADGPRAVARIAEMSRSGRAPKNAPAVFALAMAAGHPDLATRRAALAALPRRVPHRHGALPLRPRRGGLPPLGPRPARRGRGLVQRQARGAGRLPGDQVPRARRLEPPRPPAARPPPGADAGARRALPLDCRRHGRARAGRREKGKAIPADRLPALVHAFEALRAETDRRKVAALVREHHLTHEMVLTERKNDPARVGGAPRGHAADGARPEPRQDDRGRASSRRRARRPARSPRSSSTRRASRGPASTRSPCSRRSASTSRATASAPASGRTRSRGRRSGRSSTPSTRRSTSRSRASSPPARRTCWRSTSRAR